MIEFVPVTDNLILKGCSKKGFKNFATIFIYYAESTAKKTAFAFFG